jgi:hypothetical protein
LGEVYGPPLYGIKTGLNDAFVVNRATRDELIKVDARSAEILQPLLRGEDIKRWRVESKELFLINTPKGKVDIESYPGVKAWLLPFKDRLEKRATQQEWWELQQAQLAYQGRMAQPKISYPHFQNSRMFTYEPDGYFSNDKSYFIPSADYALLAYLNSKLVWFFLTSLSPAVRNGWHEMRVQYIELIPMLQEDYPQKAILADLATVASIGAIERLEIQRGVRRRILDLAPPQRRKLNGKLEAWYNLDFASFRAEVKKLFGTEIALKERGEWDSYLNENATEVHRLSAKIVAAEGQIDAIVYELFDMTSDEIALLENKLAERH